MLLPLLLAVVWLGMGPAGKFSSQGARGGGWGEKGEGQADPSSGSDPGSWANDGPPCWLAPAHHPPLPSPPRWTRRPPYPTKGNSGDPPPPSLAKKKTCRGEAAAGKARITEPEQSVVPAHQLIGALDTPGGHPRTTWTSLNI